jgi:DNA-binding transcriptional LysR family regulator
MFRPKSTFEQWRIFQAVVDCGGYAQAAEALNKSQSSLNHAVAKLQQSLGVALLEVRGRKAVLTPAGEIFLKRARQLSQQVEELENLANNLERQWGRRSTSMCPWSSRGAPLPGAGPLLSPQPRLPHQPA